MTFYNVSKLVSWLASLLACLFVRLFVNTLCNEETGLLLQLLHISHHCTSPNKTLSCNPRSYHLDKLCQVSPALESGTIQWKMRESQPEINPTNVFCHWSGWITSTTSRFLKKDHFMGGFTAELPIGVMSAVWSCRQTHTEIIRLVE